MFLIIGGGGFLGSHLRRSLARSGAPETVIVDRTSLPFPLSASERLISVDEFAGTVGDEVLSQVSAVVYLASASTVATFADTPWMELSDNVSPTFQFLHRLSRINPSAKVIFLSSGGTVYGSTGNLGPINEDHPRRPISPYGLGKVMQEEILQYFSRTTSLGYNILRVANPVGVYGKSLQQGLVTVALRAAALGEPINLFGDGTNVRDIFDADDAADAVAMALFSPELRSNIWNIGSGVGTSNREVLALIESVTGKPLKCNVLPARTGDVRGIVLDCRRVAAELGWRPTRPLRSTIEAIWQTKFQGAD